MNSVLREELGNNPIIYLHPLLVKKIGNFHFFFSAVKHHILGAFHIDGFSSQVKSRDLVDSWVILNSGKC